MLVNHGNAQTLCLIGRMQGHRLAIHQHLACIWACTTENLDQRTLPRAIFPYQRMHLMRIERQIHPAQRVSAAKLLGNAVKFNEGLR